MKISKFKISKELAAGKDLNEINLTEKELGRVVALVGKNGSGKTRILEFVNSYYEQITPKEIAENYLMDFPGTLNPAFDSAKIFFPNLLSKNATPQQTLQANTQITTRFINPMKLQVKNLFKWVNSEDIKSIEKKVATTAFTFDQLIKTPLPTNPTNTNEFSVLNSQSTLQFIKKLSDELILDKFNIHIEEDSSSKIESFTSFKQFELLKKYLDLFLGKKLSNKALKSNHGEPLKSDLFLNGKTFNFTYLSPGERTLFAYAILFFLIEINPQNNISESIIIIDEPENHLHPSAQIKLIQAIKKLISEKGQLWIATHSIPILSHLEYDEIYLVSDNRVIPPSRLTPGQSLNELMELDQHMFQMKDFISSISAWSYANFITECFKNPEVVLSGNKSDPQFTTFINTIKNNEKISLLDFGAGKGRIGRLISESEEIKNKIEYYVAIEPQTSLHNDLKNVPILKAIYEDSKDLPDSSFDYVLFCNVLHEIHPKFWLEIFKNTQRSLKDMGEIIIIEDTQMPKGENAHEFGYLIFSLKQLEVLFNSKELISFHPEKEKNKGRILCTVIPKQKINISNDTILEAISSLKDETYYNLKTLKKEENVAHGRLQAHYSQTFFNSTLAIENLPNYFNK